MKLLPCPQCAEPSFSLWAKLFLGPAARKRCSHCGAFVSVAWIPSTLVLILGTFTSFLGAVGFVAMLPSLPVVAFAAACAAGFVLGSLPVAWLYYRVVPLVVRAA